MAKYFTKSAFKIALECPWQLKYYNNDQYADASENDEFLKSLAEGGFQVGELAKIYCEVDEDADLKDLKGYQESLDRTRELMERDKVTIAEAAFLWKERFVRVDILKKDGNHIDLIEVKAKSFDSTKDTPLVLDNSRAKGSLCNKVNSDFRDYIYDVAFQKYVLENALPGYKIHAYLMMADKSTVADIMGMNQLFKIVRKDDSVSITTDPNAKNILAKSHKHVLAMMDVDEACDKIIDGKSTEQADNEYEAKVSREWEKAKTEYEEKLHDPARKRTPKAPDYDATRSKVKHPAPNYWMEGKPFKDFEAWAKFIYMGGAPTGATSLKPQLSGACAKCPFHAVEDDSNKEDGRWECWKANGVNEKNYKDKPKSSSLNGGRKRDQWMREEKYFLADLVKEDVASQSHSDSTVPGLKQTERQFLQIGLETGNDEWYKDEWFAENIEGHTYLDREGLRKEMDSWVYPLHMIDFETTAVALPYYKGMHPYEQVAFQFSHHVIYEDGRIEHVGQYLNKQVDEFPNFEFVRELRDQLSKDEGTIFRYATHENTILRTIMRQLEASTEHDKDELIAFIKTITHSGHDEAVEEKGERDMVDLLDIVKRYYYNLDEMHGSNSIKQVLPAVLNSSKYLKEKYSKAIYGSNIHSQNYDATHPIAWVTLDKDGHVESPYHKLASVGNLLGVDDSLLEDNSDDDFTVANGGAALTAYNMLMFCGTELQSDAIREALLRYCELDTMSMVFIWEYFNQECHKA